MTLQSNTNIKHAKTQEDANAIRLCLFSLEEEARSCGYEQTAAYLKLAQLFLEDRFCKTRSG